MLPAFILIGGGVLLLLNFYALIVWIADIIPFVKKYTGRKSHGITSIDMLQDYFLARKIIKKEGLDCPLSIRLFGITQILTLVYFISVAVLAVIFYR